MLTAEIPNWSGHVLMTPRTKVNEALKRQEAGYTGVYLLLGDKDGEPYAYIGEADNVRDRIKNHDIKKDWWTSAILITSAADKLDKAQVRYLEARLIELAKAAKKITLDNSMTPPTSGLKEAPKANMEVFLEYIIMVLPALGVDSFVKGERSHLPLDGDSESISSAPLFEYRVKKHNIHGTARLIDGEFVVQAGSIAAKSWNHRDQDTPYARLYAELVKTGTLREEGEHRVFKENYASKSGSAAASTLSGHPVTGPTAWKLEGQQKTYKQWEAETLAHDGPESDDR